MKKSVFILISVLAFNFNYAQHTDANVFGDVESNGEHIPFVNIYLEGTNYGTTTDVTGHFMLIDLPTGKYKIVAQSLGYKKQVKEIELAEGTTVEVNFELEEEYMSLNEIVVTGTKTFKRRTESPIIVNVLDAKVINQIQATTLSEGLCFQPGLRVETDCQTCNYTQLRMNGLGGSYSQILINSRPVFSPLTGLYGLEQIPSSMIDRIEVVRGGGSALYGSSAIGGTVNVITKIPTTNNYEFSVNQSIINGTALDNQLNGIVNVLTQKRNAGVSFFASRRDREVYDHNDDNFSELPELKNNSFGITSFFKPTHNQKIELSVSSLYEYRYGGEIIDRAAHEAEQSEERLHNVLMASVDYQIDFKNDKTNLIVYGAGQDTKRKHYTGVIPEEQEDIVEHFFNPPYGNTTNNTYQFGTQMNHRLESFLGGVNLLTIGGEYLYDKVDDKIEAYNYILDQETKNFGMFVQSDWELFNDFTLLSGVRFDKHNMVDNIVVNPRFSLLYKLDQTWQFRTSWATGFRAPQAFDADMHIAFSGGGISRIVLSPDLESELSNSFTASINYDKPTQKYIYGFTVEGFYTNLKDAFILEEVGEDDFGTIYEKRNGSKSIVQGVTLELRANYNRKVQLETGLTLQSSSFADAVEYSASLPGEKNYLRTPNDYGYYTLTYTPGNNISATLSGVYTGSMKILHVAGAPELPDSDVYKTSDPFQEIGIKLSYLYEVKRIDSGIEFFGGIKNILNEYQDDFDTGKNRDSNYIYGPSLPRTIYFGIKFKSL